MHTHTHSQLTTQCTVFCMIHTLFLSFTLTPRTATRYLATSLCWCSTAKWSKLSPNYVQTLTQGRGYIIYTQYTHLDMHACTHKHATYILYKPLDDQSKGAYANTYRCKHTCSACMHTWAHIHVFSLLSHSCTLRSETSLSPSGHCSLQYEQHKHPPAKGSSQLQVMLQVFWIACIHILY